MKNSLLSATVAAIAVALPGSAMALPATATVDLNMRSGPGPQYGIIGTIAANDTVEVIGCLPNSFWCQVSAVPGQGWAYGRYLTAHVAGEQVVIVESRDVLELPRVEYEVTGGTAVGGAAGAVTGAVVGGPVGAVVGGVAGGVGGTVLDPPDRVRIYVLSNRVEPVLLESEVVIGATVPESVELYAIPDYRYRYIYVDGEPILVDAGTRRIVHVYR